MFATLFFAVPKTVAWFAIDTTITLAESCLRSYASYVAGHLATLDVSVSVGDDNSAHIKKLDQLNDGTRPRRRQELCVEPSAPGSPTASDASDDSGFFSTSTSSSGSTCSDDEELTCDDTADHSFVRNFSSAAHALKVDNWTAPTTLLPSECHELDDDEFPEVHLEEYDAEEEEHQSYKPLLATIYEDQELVLTDLNAQLAPVPRLYDDYDDDSFFEQPLLFGDEDKLSTSLQFTAAPAIAHDPIILAPATSDVLIAESWADAYDENEDLSFLDEPLIFDDDHKNRRACSPIEEEEEDEDEDEPEYLSTFVDLPSLRRPLPPRSQYLPISTVEAKFVESSTARRYLAIANTSLQKNLPAYVTAEGRVVDLSRFLGSPL